MSLYEYVFVTVQSLCSCTFQFVYPKVNGGKSEMNETKSSGHLASGGQSLSVGYRGSVYGDMWYIRSLRL